MNIKITYTFLLLIILQFNIGCKKDKDPNLNLDQTSIWEQISGSYKVYDTSWNYLFQMNISYTLSEQENSDTICFQNFDNLFNYCKWQQPTNIGPANYILFGNYDTIVDKNNNRWKIFQNGDYDYNSFNNDTIHIRFFKSNLLFYMEDLTPYFSGWVEQYAIKQH